MTNEIAIVATILCLLALFFLAFSMLCIKRIFPKEILLWSCKTFGWHDGYGGKVGFDGCSATSKCSVCGKDVLMDGQGNWF